MSLAGLELSATDRVVKLESIILLFWFLGFVKEITQIYTVASLLL